MKTIPSPFSLALVLALGCAASAAPEPAAAAKPARPLEPAAARQDAGETFEQLVERLSAAKQGKLDAHRALLESRYDLADRPAAGRDA